MAAASESPPPRSGTRGRWVPLVVLAGAGAVLAAATTVPWRVTDRFGVFGELSPPQSEVTPVPQPSASVPPVRPDSAPPGWLTLALWAVGVLVVLAVLFWVWRILPRRAPRQASTGGGLVATGVLEPSAPVLREGFGTARHLLDTLTDPTDAVVAAWVALEQAAERSGVPRRPADTPTELTTQVLAATEADAAAVDGLLALYHRARFGGGVRPEDVVQARRHVDALGASWRRFSTDAPAGPHHPGPDFRPGP